MFVTVNFTITYITFIFSEKYFASWLLQVSSDKIVTVKLSNIRRSLLLSLLLAGYIYPPFVNGCFRRLKTTAKRWKVNIYGRTSGSGNAFTHKPVARQGKEKGKSKWADNSLFIFASINESENATRITDPAHFLPQGKWHPTSAETDGRCGGWAISTGNKF